MEVYCSSTTRDATSTCVEYANIWEVDPTAAKKKRRGRRRRRRRRRRRKRRRQPNHSMLLMGGEVVAGINLAFTRIRRAQKVGLDKFFL